MKLSSILYLACCVSVVISVAEGLLPGFRGSSPPRTALAPTHAPVLDFQNVPIRGITDYIGNTTLSLSDVADLMPQTTSFGYIPPRTGEALATKFALWRQYPWKKFKGKVVLKAKLGGDLALEAPPQGGFLSGLSRQPDLQSLSSLEQTRQLLQFGAYDPRVAAVFIELGGLACGYAKLAEVQRDMRFFRQSGKPIYVYMSTGSEKEVFLALEANELYIPPDGGLDLRGFSAAASFFRGVFEKIGLEPQVQRIGKYKVRSLSFASSLSIYIFTSFKSDFTLHFS